MQISQLQRFNIEDEIKEKIVSIFKGKLNFNEVFKIEEDINNLDKTTYESVIKEIFSSAREEKYPINRSRASKSFMGIANKIANRRKNRKNKRRRRNPNLLKIFVEGDSWFEHPFIKEIIDHLIDNSNYAIHTLAYGGDWIGNYLQEQKYLKKLLHIKPSVFLLSGGGNDLVGEGRLHDLVVSKDDIDPKFDHVEEKLFSVYKSEYGEDRARKIVYGKKFLNNRFWTLINIFTFQYLLIIRSIENEPDLKGIKIITQGYDFAIPSKRKHNLFRKTLGHSKWLYKPLSERGIKDPYDQESIIAAMIYEFNEMLIALTRKKDNVFHIDCRGAAKRNQWNDELHLHSIVYKKIAKTMITCIEDNSDKKIYTVR